MEPDIAGTIWRFVRGDTPSAQFEQWVYANPQLAESLPEDIYMDRLSTDYRATRQQAELRKRRSRYMLDTQVLPCECQKLPTLVVLDMFDAPAVLTLRLTHKRGGARWWLGAMRCKMCNQDWLFARESRINDVYILRRMSPDENESVANHRWPPDFDLHSTLLEIGREAGHSARFLDTFSPDLVFSTEDLMKEDDQLRPERLADLLQVSPSHANHLIAHVRAGRAVIKDAGS